MLVSMHDVLRALAERQLTLAVAEGDTGGLLLERLATAPGRSAVILGGVEARAGGVALPKPVGLAYVAAATAAAVLVRVHHWHGDRHADRQSRVTAALALL